MAKETNQEITVEFLIEEIKIGKTIEISPNEDLINLFKMTPYYYKTGVEDQKKTENLNSLSVKAEFGIRIYRKEEQNA